MGIWRVDVHESFGEERPKPFSRGWKISRAEDGYDEYFTSLDEAVVAAKAIVADGYPWVRVIDKYRPFQSSNPTDWESGNDDDEGHTLELPKSNLYGDGVISATSKDSITIIRSGGNLHSGVDIVAAETFRSPLRDNTGLHIMSSGGTADRGYRLDLSGDPKALGWCIGDTVFRKVAKKPSTGVFSKEQVTLIRDEVCKELENRIAASSCIHARHCLSRRG